MSNTSETALDRAFALLKCSPIKDPENSSEYGRAAYNLSVHCQGKEDVSEAAMRIFAHRIAELERELNEARAELEEYRSIAENIGAEKAVSEKEKAIRERDEAREISKELLNALSKLVALNTKMTSDDCTYERAYYCYYKGHYDKWKLATEALAKAREGAK
jgi:vacuolar-type H+-ATPase subunit I/STV1